MDLKDHPVQRVPSLWQPHQGGAQFQHTLRWEIITPRAALSMLIMTLLERFCWFFLKYGAQTCLLTISSAPLVALSKHNTSSPWQHFSYFPLKISEPDTTMHSVPKDKILGVTYNPLSSPPMHITHHVSCLPPKSFHLATSLHRCWHHSGPRHHHLNNTMWQNPHAHCWSSASCHSPHSQETLHLFSTP